MRRLFLLLAAVAVGGGLAACGSSGSTATTSSAGATASTLAGMAGCTNASIQGYLYHRGQLTVATDNPAYPPWFKGNDPSNGKGYESAVAYAVAKELGFKPSQVHWTYEPFNKSYAPGPKAFDFDINEISYTPARASVVTFSISYYADHEALVALKGSPIVKDHSPAQLKTYQYGDQIGTTDLAYINSVIQPSAGTKVFNTLNDVQAALSDHEIEAFVTDTPTAQYIADGGGMKGAVVVGQFPNNGEHFGLLFHKGDPLVACVNKALTALWSDGTIKRIATEYLQDYLTIPTIKP
jgi:polar amino acid transport system substrate-binding protein